MQTHHHIAYWIEEPGTEVYKLRSTLSKSSSFHQVFIIGDDVDFLVLFNLILGQQRSDYA